MKKYIFGAICAALAMSACVDVNLRSEMPQIAYYKLDLANLNTDISCDNFKTIGLTNIDIPAEYKQNRALYLKDSMMNYIPNANFIPSIAQSMENMLFKIANNNCARVVVAPFSGLNVEEYLSVKLLDFYIDMDSNEAVVSLAYRLSKGDLMKNDFVSLRQEFEDSSDDFSSEIKKLSATLQSAMQKLIENIK